VYIFIYVYLWLFKYFYFIFQRAYTSILCAGTAVSSSFASGNSSSVRFGVFHLFCVTLPLQERFA